MAHEEKIMDNKFRFVLPILAIIISISFVEPSQAAPTGGATEVEAVFLNYKDGQITIVGTGLNDGASTNKPIVTLGGELVDPVILVGDNTIQGDIDLVTLFPFPGDFLLIDALDMIPGGFNAVLLQTSQVIQAFLST